MPAPYKIRTRDEHFADDGPKRVLALDGGGLKGIVTLGFLARMESTAARAPRRRRFVSSRSLLRSDRGHVDGGDHRGGPCQRNDGC